MGLHSKKPLEEFNTIEKMELNALPEILPTIAVWQKVKLYRNCHVHYQYCQYSAPFDLYHEELWLKQRLRPFLFIIVIIL